MAAFLDGCKFTAVSSGTGDFVVSAAAAGAMTPAQANAVTGRLYKYYAKSTDNSQWEFGEGAYTVSSVTQARTTVLFSSTGSKVSFTVAPTVAIVALKEDLLSVEEANTFSSGQRSRARANLDVTKFNYVLNGGMMVSQQNLTTAGTTTGYYPVDQFGVWWPNGTGTLSVAQVASLTAGGSPNRLRCTVTATDTGTLSASKYYVIKTIIEGLRVTDLMLGTATAKPLVLQFGVKAPAGTYCVVFTNYLLSRCYVVEYVISSGQANTDVTVSMTIPGDVTGSWINLNYNGIEIYWCLGVGSTYQNAAGSWAVGPYYGSANQFNFMNTNANVFELYDVGLYEGTAAPPFKVPDYAAELAACQRFWVVVSSGARYFGPFLCFSTTQAFGGYIKYPVTMRAVPTLNMSAFTDFGLTTNSSTTTAALTGGSFVDLGLGVACRLNNCTLGSGVLFAGDSTMMIGLNSNARVWADVRM